MWTVEAKQLVLIGRRINHHTGHLLWAPASNRAQEVKWVLICNTAAEPNSARSDGKLSSKQALYLSELSGGNCNRILISGSGSRCECGRWLLIFQTAPILDELAVAPQLSGIRLQRGLD